MARIRTGFKLLSQSAQVVREEPALIGAITLGLVVQIAMFLVLFFAVFERAPQFEDFRWPGMLWIFPIVFVAGIPGSLAGATVVAAAMQKLEGGEGSVRAAFQLALNRFPQIVLFNLLAAGVGLLIQFIAEKLKLGGRFAALVVGASWTVVTLLVIPVILFEDKNAFEAVKRSGSLIRERWGEGVTGHGAVAVAVALIVGPFMIIGGILLPFNLLVGIVVMVTSALILMTVAGALGGVFNAALYRYAADGVVGDPFDRGQLDAAFVSRRDRREASPARRALRITSVLLVVVYVVLRILRSQLGAP